VFEQKKYKIEQLKKDLEKLEKECERRWNVYQKAKTNNEKDHAASEEYLTIIEQTKLMKENLKYEIENNKDEDNDYFKIPNFTKEFEKFIKEKYKSELTPEQILGYIYAILYCPDYRKKYNVFLKIDYPKIPFISDYSTFIQLSNIGNDLIKAHLIENDFIESIKDNYDMFDIKGEGKREITKIDFIDNKVWINKNQYLENISDNIWNFKIGAFYPIQKYLKDRKGQILELENIDNLENQIIAISFTIEKINELENITKQLI
jgi:predicted helicase